jgi:hypothetical protein
MGAVHLDDNIINISRRRREEELSLGGIEN